MGGGVAVSDIDLDGDADNNSTSDHRAPARSPGEDVDEYPNAGYASESQGMKVGEEWVKLVVSAHVKRRFLGELNMDSITLQYLWKISPRRCVGWLCFFATASLLWVAYSNAQQPSTLDPPADPFKSSLEKDDATVEKLVRIRKREEQRITLMQATLFHQLLLERCQDKLPEQAMVRYVGPLSKGSQRLGQHVHGGPAAMLEWQVYNSKVSFSFWISTVCTTETLVSCKVKDDEMFVNISSANYGRSVDEPLEELGDMSARDILEELSKSTE